MLGVELVTDRELKTPAKLETLHIMDQMKGNFFQFQTFFFLLFIKLVFIYFFK